MARSQAFDLTINDLASNDVLIAVMGPTGSGKSTIIDVLTEDTKRRASSGLASCTQEISATRLLNHSTYGDRIVLIDTPGFDDTRRSDLEVLEMVGEWLKKTYEQEVEIAGIIFLHRILSPRLTGTHHRNLRMFAKLCGKNAANKVLLTTTTWDISEPGVAERREADLKKKFWEEMINNGAKVGRFHNDKLSAEVLVNEVLKETTREMFLLQEELCVCNQSINETSAGREIYSNLRTLLYERKKSLTALSAQDNRNRQEAEDLYGQIEDPSPQENSALIFSAEIPGDGLFIVTDAVYSIF